MQTEDDGGAEDDPDETEDSRPHEDGEQADGDGHALDDVEEQARPRRTLGEPSSRDDHRDRDREHVAGEEEEREGHERSVPEPARGEHRDAEHHEHAEARRPSLEQGDGPGHSQRGRQRHGGDTSLSPPSPQ